MFRKAHVDKEQYRQRFDKYLTADRKVRNYLRSTEKLSSASQSSDSESVALSDISIPTIIDRSYCSNTAICDVPDDILTRIFTYLSTRELCTVSGVSQKWHKLCWNPELWTSIDLCDVAKNVDEIIERLLSKLASHSKFTCLIINTIKLSGSQLLSEEGLKLIGQRCPELQRLEVSRCPGITGKGIRILLSNCPNLSFLNVSGCDAIDKVNCESPNGISFEENALFLQLKYLDLSDCQCLNDKALERTARCSSFLEYLYL